MLAASTRRRAITQCGAIIWFLSRDKLGQAGQGDNGDQGGSDGSGRHSAAPMLTAIMSGGVGISGRELSLSC